MKNLIVSASLLATVPFCFAADAPPAEHQISGTATVVSDYIFRGLTQTWHRPAIQAGVDYVHASGFYGSVWGSTVSDKIIAGAHAEIDLVAGYRGAINEDWTYGAGVISIFYPGANWNKMRWGARPDQRYDFSEASAFIGYQAVSLKYSQALNDVFGYGTSTGFTGSTRNSSYVELNADFPLADTGIVLGLHAGRQNFKATANGINADFNDYRVSLTKEVVDRWTVSLQLSTNSNKVFYNDTISNLDETDRRDVGKTRAVLSLTRAF